MEQSPFREANRSSVRQEISLILRGPKVHYCTHKSPPPVRIMSQLDPVHTLTFHFLNPLNAKLIPICYLLALLGARHILHVSRIRANIHLNIILPSAPRFPKWSLPLRFPHQNPVYFSPLPHSFYIPRPSHFSRFYHPNNTW